jgi:hypothetical protein
MVGSHGKLLKRLGFRLRGACSRSPKGKTIVIAGDSMPKPGVYTFVVGNKVNYIGTAKNLRQRLNAYQSARIPTRRYTSHRVKLEILSKLKDGAKVKVFTLAVRNHKWKGLSINNAGSIELALIDTLKPPWNIIGVGDREVVVEL